MSRYQNRLDVQRNQPNTDVNALHDKIVNSPAHYVAGEFEVYEVCEAFGLDKDAYLFNVVKYVLRCGSKHPDPLADLEKALWYLQRRIDVTRESRDPLT